jgi:hypothetical protein
MDHLVALINRVYESLPVIHGQMSPSAWEAFEGDLTGLQPIVDEGADEKLRIKAFYQLYESCLKYEPVRRQLPRDPTMLAGPPKRRQKDEPIDDLHDDPQENRVSDVIKRMKELGTPPPPPVPPKKPGDST